MISLRLCRSPQHLTTPQLAEALGLDRSLSAFAKIDPQALAVVARFLTGQPELRDARGCAWDDPLYWYPEGSPRERSQYFAIGCAINFRFWRLAGGAVVPLAGRLDGVNLSGAMYMWRCLRRALDHGRFPLLDASFLAAIDREQFAAIFSDDDGVNPLRTAASERLANWRDLGTRLLRDWQGQFYNLLTAAGSSLVEFVELSRHFRAFDDPLFKLTMVNSILCSGGGVARFDADPLPGIDYHLMQQLLRQGVLLPVPALRAKLERRVLLTNREGRELRRLALCAFVELSVRTGLSGEILDNLWWWNRVQCRTEGPVCLSLKTAHQCAFFSACARITGLGMPLERTRYY